ncbi:MAG TPA: glutaminase A [Ilumatobacteraceae bacterium]|nr:glutaminase A [Ilumatobacteraceae bacterium]
MAHGRDTSIDPDPIRDALAVVVERFRSDESGHVATYIPELATVDPDGFGATLVSVHGRVHSAGDSDRPFTIQSVSKPFVYALAVSELGLDEVALHVGFEPSGEPFNAISLDPHTGRPDNPLVNAGAIVTSALIDGPTVQDRFERVRSFLSACAGRELGVNDDVFASETTTGDRNRALAHLARSSGVLRQSVDDATEVYFRQCSIEVTTEDLAVMGATLANGGINPLTKRRIMGERAATLTLSIMATCGMYDHSGEWMARVGLPAKSGVGGGIAAIQPAQFGFGVYSPRLDSWGNSVRGAAVLQSLSNDFDLHVFDHPDQPRSPVVSWAIDGGGARGVLRGELDLISAEQGVEVVLDGDLR